MKKKPRVSPFRQRRNGSAAVAVPDQDVPASTLQLNFKGEVARFIKCVVSGRYNEIAVFGTRGDGKTQGAFGGMIAYAREHKRRGFDLPVKGLGVTDTFQSHKAKTHESLQKPFWKGCWTLRDGGHLAVFTVDGVELVHLYLFGIEDQGAMDRVRAECHFVWFEEPAPAAILVQSSGVNETAWNIALTSRRNPSYCHPAFMTLNYPDDEHWTWQRFVVLKLPGTKYFRIPPGERASAEDRQSWKQSLKNRPDLLKRLLEGQPGSVLMGRQVADGFREDLHVSKERLLPVKHEPIGFGQDFGLTPATVIGQRIGGERRIYAAFPCPRGGIKQHLENAVIPYLKNYAAWALAAPDMYIQGTYDPAGNTPDESDIEQSPLRVIETMLGGHWQPGPVDWESRKGLLIGSINSHVRPGELSLQLDPVLCKPLIKALSGHWHYPENRLGQVSKDMPKKPNHPWEDLGDGLIYLLAQLGLMRQGGHDSFRVETDFDPLHDNYDHDESVEVDASFSVF